MSISSSSTFPPHGKNEQTTQPRKNSISDHEDKVQKQSGKISSSSSEKKKEQLEGKKVEASKIDQVSQEKLHPKTSTLEVKEVTKKAKFTKNFEMGMQVGSTELKHLENGKWKTVAIDFVVVGSKGNTICFEARDKNGTPLGEIELELIQSLKGGEPWKSYPDCETGSMFLFVHGVYTRKYQKDYKGVGTALMQLAMEYGNLKGCEGRIKLDSSWNSQRFYLDEIHMQAMDPDKEIQLNKNLNTVRFQKAFKDEKYKQLIILLEGLLNGKDIVDLKKEMKKNFNNHLKELIEKFKEFPQTVQILEKLNKQQVSFLEKIPDAFPSEKGLTVYEPDFDIEIFTKGDIYDQLQILKKSVANPKSERSRDMGGYILYLSKEQVPRWNARIAANPILKP